MGPGKAIFILSWQIENVLRGLRGDKEMNEEKEAIAAFIMYLFLLWFLF